jgi:hypothetical protein
MRRLDELVSKYKNTTGLDRNEGDELMHEIELLKIENEQLKEQWNIAYDYGVRVEVDWQTGFIHRHWLESESRSK